MNGHETSQSPAVELHRFEDDGVIPNNRDLPLLHYRGVLGEEADPAAAFETLFAANDWRGGWRNGIFPYHHYHSTSHEVLGIARGEAEVMLGGDGGARLTVKAGDVVVIPAGVGHKNLGASADFLVVGAYPEGRNADLLTGRPGEREEAIANIRRVPMPAADPVRGRDGPLLRHWRMEVA